MIRKVEIPMKKQLILYKYKAPARNLKFRVANPKPAVHKGISAVAMATPGIGFPFSALVMETAPTIPPKNAMSTSYIVGEVLAKSSDCTSLNGLN